MIGSNSFEQPRLRKSNGEGVFNEIPWKFGHRADKLKPIKSALEIPAEELRNHWLGQ